MIDLVETYRYVAVDSDCEDVIGGQRNTAAEFKHGLTYVEALFCICCCPSGYPDAEGKAAAGVKMPGVEFHLNRNPQVMEMLVVRRFENTFIIQTGVDSPKSVEIVSETHSAARLYVGV